MGLYLSRDLAAGHNIDTDLAIRTASEMRYVRSNITEMGLWEVPFKMKSRPRTKYKSLAPSLNDARIIHHLATITHISGIFSSSAEL